MMRAPSRRFLAVILPTLPTDRARRRARRFGGPAASDAPLVTIAKEKSALRLVGLDARATALGLSPGLALADARARRPDLVAVEADPQAEAALLSRLVDWARRYTPLVADDAPDGLVLDITGSSHLFGGEAALLADVEGRLAAQGFATQAAIAGTPEAASALARAADGSRVPSGAEEEVLRPLPIAALAIDAERVAALERVGLRSIGDVMDRPRAPLAARFGPDLLDRLDAALGLTRSTIGARLEAPLYIAERRFFEPILSEEAVMGTVRHLCDDLARMLVTHGEGALRLELTLFRVDGQVRRIETGASRPARDPARLALLFHERLASGQDELDVGYGFDVVRLAILGVARLDEGAPRLDGAPGEEDLARLLDRLGARLGLRLVRRLEARDEHWPEWAVAVPPAEHARHAASAWDPVDRGAFPDRPIRLFARPELVETIASVPDGPPLRFRWRRVLHEIAAYEGPERIAPAWWGEGKGLTRDYFRAEDRRGRRFWLFREGLYGRETEAPRWYVHGLFA
jgi:protein ImuB